MAANAHQGALAAIVSGDEADTDTQQGEITATELADLRMALSQVELRTTPIASPLAVCEEREKDAAITGLWAQLLAEAEQLADKDIRGDAIERHGDEMESDGPQEMARSFVHSDSLISLDAHLSTLDAECASSLRQSIGHLLAEAAKSDDEVAAALAEMLGFENLNLVAELITQRDSVAQDLEEAVPSAALRVKRGSSSRKNASTASNQQPGSKPAPGTRPYVPGAQIRVQSAEEISQGKALRVAKRRMLKKKGQSTHAEQQQQQHLTIEQMEELRQQQLFDNANRPLFSSEFTSSDQPKYPHVFSSEVSGNSLSVFGSKFSLPAGTFRSDHKEYEEVIIPQTRAIPMRSNERLIPIDEMDRICQEAFPAYKSLNRLQSLIYPLGYGTNENLLVCAPTGAGKTDVAMLTVIRAVSQFSADVHGGRPGGGYGISLDDFKIVYVAPMKALAAEVVRKFSKRLSYLGIKVRELTGDMQMSRQEIAETQMIVTTPEKWDVVTRKPTGEGELATKVRLLIIDEVHLLHEDRGAVIETIVARTLRLVESSQTPIRIVGLSATLPNYVDVADFLRVNRYQGLFYFDSSFRPVPLEQHFIGIKGKPGSAQARTNLDKATFLKVEQLLHEDRQVMIFVPARKETVKSALSIREMCRSKGIEDLLLMGRKDREGQVSAFKRELTGSRNKEMRELFESGLGIHHAGMLRSDRTLSERMFEAGVTKVLCCTSTLAWGVNLPAYAVLIKGTEVYDSSLGRFTNLSILDVLQIFGRAGRPQYEDLGVGYILTPQEKLSHYVDAMTSQHPIESKFEKRLVDSLNAECALGTVQSLSDGIAWLSYTYFFTRMRRNPLAYGMSRDEVVDDPHIGAKRLSLVTSGAKALVDCKMLELDQATGKLSITDLGRIAARYYIPWRTIETFNKKLRPSMTEADVLSVLALATDFDQIKSRDSEEKELKKMLEIAPCEVTGGIETSPGKVNILLQAYISRTYVEDFALASDTAYVAQNAGRIIRALFEISLSQRWAGTTLALMSMSKAVERRMWPFAHPLTQSTLNADTLFNLQRWADEIDIQELASMTASQIGELIHLDERIGDVVRTAAKRFPHLNVTHRLRPLTHEQLRLVVDVERAFDWNERVHSGLEAFYLWIEDEAGTEIQQWSRMTFHPTTERTRIVFTLIAAQPYPCGVNVRWVSDGWIGAEGSHWVSFKDVVMPPAPIATMPLLDLPLLPISSALAKMPSETRTAYLQRFLAFNAIQTQAFHTVMHTSADFLLCAPVASGKTTLVEMAIWRTLHQHRSARILVLLPHHQLLLQHFQRFSELYPMIRSRIAANPQEVAIEDRSLREEVTFVLPEHVLQVLVGSPEISSIRRCKLFVAEDLHAMGAAYELVLQRIIKLARARGSRLVATSASLHDATSLAEWLGVRELGRYFFHAKDRPIPLQLSSQSFDIAHSVALLKLMVKPAYDKAAEVIRIKRGPVILFVPSRAQCFATASDFATRAASELNQEGFLGASPKEVEAYLTQLSDEKLYEPILYGIGVYHEGLHPRDRSLVLELYRSHVIKVLVASKDSCWSLPVRAGLVVIMSTRFVQLSYNLTPSKQGSTIMAEDTQRRIVDYPAVDLLRMMSLAASMDHAGECFFMCQSEQVDQLNQLLQDGLALESELLEYGSPSPASGVVTADVSSARAVIMDSLLREIAGGHVVDVQDILDRFAGSFLCHRLRVNPVFYDMWGPSHRSFEERISIRLSQTADEMIAVLAEAGLIAVGPAQLHNSPRLSMTLLGTAVIEEASQANWALLLEISQKSRGHPSLAAALSSETLQHARKGARTDIFGTSEAALHSVHDRTPSAWLQAFGLPPVDRKSRKARQTGELASDTNSSVHDAQVTRHGKLPHVAHADDVSSLMTATTSEVDPERTGDLDWRLHTPALLLAAYFAGVPLSTGAHVPTEVAELQAHLVLEVFSRASNMGGVQWAKQK